MPRGMRTIIIMPGPLNNETSVGNVQPFLNGDNIALLRTKDYLSTLRSWHK